MTAACKPARNLADDQDYAAWRKDLTALFPVADEFALADAIYPFGASYLDGMTPQETYNAFDEWTTGEAS